MGLLDLIPEPYEPPHARTLRFRKGQIDENLEALNNMGRALVTEDFEDSSFADREALPDNNKEV